MVDGPRKLSKQASEGNRHYEKGKRKLLYDTTAGRTVDVSCMIPSTCAYDHHKGAREGYKVHQKSFQQSSLLA